MNSLFQDFFIMNDRPTIDGTNTKNDPVSRLNLHSTTCAVRCKVQLRVWLGSDDDDVSFVALHDNDGSTVTKNLAFQTYNTFIFVCTYGITKNQCMIYV